jgi:hypothetical protein
LKKNVLIKETLEQYPILLEKIKKLYELESVYASELRRFKFSIPSEVPKEVGDKIQNDIKNSWHYNFAEFQGRMENNEYIPLENINQRFKIFKERVIDRMEEIANILLSYEVFSREILDKKLRAL